MKRLGRTEASQKWLERYVMQLDGRHLNREFILLLQAVSDGLFTPAARQLLMDKINDWLEELSNDQSAVNEQKTQWKNLFVSFTACCIDNYPLLKDTATNYSDLETSLKFAKSYSKIEDYIKKAVDGANSSARPVKNQLDDIITYLVTNFDSEELGIRRQARANELVAQFNGDRQAAQDRLNIEKHIFDSNVNLLQLLTNVIINPELSGAGKSVQALALAICKPLMIQVLDTYTAQNRNNVVSKIDIKLENFTVSTADGSDEEEHLKKLETYFLAKGKSDRKKSLVYILIFAAIILVMAGFLVYSMLDEDFDKRNFAMFAFGSFIPVLFIWALIKQLNVVKKRTKDLIIKLKEALRGCLAEVVDYRLEWKKEDAKAEELRGVFNAIEVSEFAGTLKEVFRNFIN
jgi:hypothetical protein